ncbi:hypothetical protein MYX04_14745, partial [Nitrospiraceae bacterium AH_259_D15_M11_P09]|nr:hypothetical protein [Nitrospiraceae bacterium AH_259_D15_M11_P09]
HAIRRLQERLDRVLAMQVSSSQGSDRWRTNTITKKGHYKPIVAFVYWAVGKIGVGTPTTELMKTFCSKTYPALGGEWIEELQEQKAGLTNEIEETLHGEAPYLYDPHFNREKRRLYY